MGDILLRNSFCDRNPVPFVNLMSILWATLHRSHLMAKPIPRYDGLEPIQEMIGYPSVGKWAGTSKD